MISLHLAIYWKSIQVSLMEIHMSVLQIEGHVRWCKQGSLLKIRYDAWQVFKCFALQFWVEWSHFWWNFIPKGLVPYPRPTWPLPSFKCSWILIFATRVHLGSKVVVEGRVNSGGADACVDATHDTSSIHCGIITNNLIFGLTKWAFVYISGMWDFPWYFMG